jgi:hypothetical protein
MELLRRTLLHLAASAVVLPAASRIGSAQNAPPRPVRVIGTFIAANVDGLLARLVSQSLSERLGQPVVVDNQPTIPSVNRNRVRPCSFSLVRRFSPTARRVQFCSGK